MAANCGSAIQTCAARRAKSFRCKASCANWICWITGLRRNQADSRSSIIGLASELYTLDEHAGLDIVKLNPMASWTREAVWDYIKKHKIPFNPLHDKGYRSIGCKTCTVKTGEGDDDRAGRWIGFKKVECGIHTFMSRKADFQI